MVRQAVFGTAIPGSNPSAPAIFLRPYYRQTVKYLILIQRLVNFNISSFMRLSHYFLPALKETPAEAQIVFSSTHAKSRE